MHRGERLPLVSANEPMSTALVTMTEKSFGCLGIVGEDGRLLGIVTDGDLRRHMAPNLLGEIGFGNHVKGAENGEAKHAGKRRASDR